MSDAPRQPPPKKDVALVLLEESSVFIHLDPRRPEVVVPKSFMGQPQLVLQVGLNMAIPIPDLKIDDLGITCTLSFHQRPFWCRIPWPAVYALVGEDGRGSVWPDDVPPEIQIQKQSSRPSQAKRPRPRLQAVAGGAAPERRSTEEGDDRPAEASKGEPDHGGAETGPTLRPAGAGADRVRRIPRAVPEPSRDERAPEDDPTPPPPARIGPRPVPSPADEPSAPSAAPPSGGKKPKREIPPWLRVIK